MTLCYLRKRMRMKLYICLSLIAAIDKCGNTATFHCSSAYDRVPVDTDLTVLCGKELIVLEVNLCSAHWAGFNASALAVNGEYRNTQCLGLVDPSTDPPVVRYQLPVNNSLENPCRQSLQIVDESPGSGDFSSLSSMQWVIISGSIETPRPSEGVISYSINLRYRFSCRYPLEYLVNQTQIPLYPVSMTTSGNNGTFIRFLSMRLYNDTGYSQPLIVPEEGIPLHTKIFVEVKASNLSENLYVLLDHCFATPSLSNKSTNETHDFFVGCRVESKTTVELNGLDTMSRFHFEVFSFLDNSTPQKSSLYLHCITRLCNPSSCQTLLNMCKTSGKMGTKVLDPFGTKSINSTMISVGPIYTSNSGPGQNSSSVFNAANQTAHGLDTTGIVVGMAFGTGAVVLAVTGGWFAIKKLLCTGPAQWAFH